MYEANSPHAHLQSNVDKLLAECKTKFDNKIETEGIPNGKDFEAFVRVRRKKVLYEYADVKVKVPGLILNRLNTVTTINEIDNINQGLDSLHQLDVEIIKANSETDDLRKRDADSIYDTFIKFQTESSELFETLNKKHRIRDLRSILIGTAISVLCAALDVFLLNNVFIAGNYSVTESMLTAIIFAGTMDIPPYLLGTTIMHRDDKKKQNALANVSIEKKKQSMRLNTIQLFGLSTFMLIIVLVYIFVRFFVFFGGGDFNAAFKDVFSGNFVFLNYDFYAADLLSALAPLGTTIVSFVVGMQVHVSYSDFIQEVAFVADKKLDEGIRLSDYKRNDLEKQKKDIMGRIQKQQSELAATHGVKVSVFKDLGKSFLDEGFSTEVVTKKRQVELTLYLQLYKSLSKQIRVHASNMMNNVTMQLASYAGDPALINRITVDGEEQKMLDDFWIDVDVSAGSSLDEFASQTLSTKNDIKIINKKIEEISKNY